MKCVLPLLFALGNFGFVVSAMSDEPKADRVMAAAADQIRLSDAEGTVSSPADWRDKRVVLVFVGLECPVANSYVPEVKSLQTEFAAAKFSWLAVHSDKGVTAAQAQKHAKEYAITLPTLLDGEQRLAHAVGAERIGQTVVLDRGEIVYRGRIDDRYAANGRRREEPSSRELRDVLTALRDGRKPTVADAPAYGCPIPNAPPTATLPAAR